MPTQKSTEDEYEYIYVPYFFHKKLGRRIYAHKYGKKAFRIRVKKRKH